MDPLRASPWDMQTGSHGPMPGCIDLALRSTASGQRGPQGLGVAFQKGIDGLALTDWDLASAEAARMGALSRAKASAPKAYD